MCCQQDLFFVVFFLVIAFIFLITLKILTVNTIQKNSPRITTYAKLIDKRNHVFSERSHYYGTFELDSGDRIELRLPREQSGLLVIGDEGYLTFQGDRFLSLENDA